jgi:hypothetical protein
LFSPTHGLCADQSLLQYSRVYSQKASTVRVRTHARTREFILVLVLGTHRLCHFMYSLLTSNTRSYSRVSGGHPHDFCFRL